MGQNGLKTYKKIISLYKKFYPGFEWFIMVNVAKSESFEQRKLVHYVRTMYPDILFFSIPNGGLRDGRTASTLKKEGILPGASDLMVAEPVGKFHGLFIEMKRPIMKGMKKPTLSKTQKEFAREISIRGYAFAVAFGYTDALIKLIDYLEKKHNAYQKTQTAYLSWWGAEPCL